MPFLTPSVMSATAQLPASESNHDPATLEEPFANDVVALNSKRPFTPRPLIADILRKRFCTPGSIFMVERIDKIDETVALGQPTRRRAVRLLLGDGELCVQAVLRPRLHVLLDGGVIYPGCYVKLNFFRLRLIDLAASCEDISAAGRGGRCGEGPSTQMAFLLTENLIVVGWNNAYLRMLGVEPPRRQTQELQMITGGSRKFLAPQHVRSAGPTPAARLEDAQHEDRRDSAESSLSDDDFEIMKASGNRGRSISRTTALSYCPSRTPSDALTWISNDPSQPLKLTTLHAISNLPCKKNWMVNVLVVVVSLSDPEPCAWPPFSQRQARLADPTTSKQVLLNVFLDAEEFDPRVGSVVLLLGVKNHMSDGGSLKKYANDRPKNSLRWWMEEPSDLEWCNVSELRSWWDARA